MVRFSALVAALVVSSLFSFTAAMAQEQGPRDFPDGTVITDGALCEGDKYTFTLELGMVIEIYPEEISGSKVLIGIRPIQADGYPSYTSCYVEWRDITGGEGEPEPTAEPTISAPTWEPTTEPEHTSEPTAVPTDEPEDSGVIDDTDSDVDADDSYVEDDTESDVIDDSDSYVDQDEAEGETEWSQDESSLVVTPVATPAVHSTVMEISIGTTIVNRLPNGGSGPELFAPTEESLPRPETRMESLQEILVYIGIALGIVGICAFYYIIRYGTFGTKDDDNREKEASQSVRGHLYPGE